MRKLIVSDDQFKAIKYSLANTLRSFKKEEEQTEIYLNYKNAYQRIENAEYVEDIIKKTQDEDILNFLQERI